MKTKFETVIGLYKGIIEDKATTDDEVKVMPGCCKEWKHFL
jgi:hypothetical protein